jgi:Zn-dependent protease
VIGKIKGIEIEIHLSWLIIFGLITFTMATSYFPTYNPAWSATMRWVEGGVVALLLFLSVLLHELSHSLVSKNSGLDVKRITLFIFGGVAQIEGEPTHPLQELKIAIAGPAMSIFLFGLLVLLANLLKMMAVPEYIYVPLSYIGDVNIVLAVFNLVPAFPLDGGRVLRALIWHFSGNQIMATRFASSMGALFAYILIFTGVFWMLSGNFINGLWLAFIGWFLHQMSQSGYQQTIMGDLFKNIPVREFMTSPVETVDYFLSTQVLVDHYFLKYKYSIFPVAKDGSILGITNVDRVSRIPREQWGQTTVAKITIPLSENLVVTPGETVAEVMPKLFGNGIGRVLVMENSQLIGIVSRTDVLNYIRVRTQLDQ